LEKGILAKGASPRWDEGSWRDSNARWLQHNTVVIGSLGLLLDQARKARRLAQSYSHKLYGSVALTFGPDGEYHVFSGANLKAFRGQTPAQGKLCAETSAHNEVKKAGHGLIVAFLTTGPVQPDDATGVIWSTTPPCQGCRALFRESRLVHPRTIIVSVAAETHAIEIRRVAELAQEFGEV